MSEDQSQKKYLIIGVNGLVGESVCDEIDGLHQWVGTSYKRSSNNAIHCNILDEKSIKQVFDEVKPDCVIHAANLAGGVQFCEKNQDLAKSFHFEATQSLGRMCLEYGSKFIY